MTALRVVRADASTLRRRNRAVVLAALRALGPVSHTEIAAWSGLSSAAVSSITAELEAEGALERIETAPTGNRGRPRVLFRHRPDHAHVAIVRTTFESIEFSLVDYAGTLIDRFADQRSSAAQPDKHLFIAGIRDGLGRLASRSRLGSKQVRLVSITSKGLVAEDARTLLWSPVLGDGPIDLGAALPAGWQAGITLTNETRFVAQALARSKRDGRQARRTLVLSLDHGIGLGIATSGDRGEIDTQAPPFGHMVHDSGGPLCRCGAHGCIEAYAGFYGILRTAFQVPDDTIPARFIPLDEMDKLASRARRGDRQAEFAFRRAGTVLGLGIARLTALFGAMPLTVTGPGLRYFDLIEPGFTPHLSSGLQGRFGAPVDVTLNADEAAMIYDGNLQATLATLDTNVFAER